MAPVIFDRRLLRARRDRAAESLASADFLLQEMAERLADRLDDIQRRFPRALDVGSHSGQLARALQGRGGIETLVGMDLSPAMLARQDGPRVAADEEWLPFADHTFDLILSCGSLHWVNDLPGALAQLARALKPDGLFLAILPGGDTLHELRSAMLLAAMETEGGVSPRISPFLDVREAGGLLQRAGLALPVVDTETIVVRYEHVFALMRDLKAMGETNTLAVRPRAPLRRDTLQQLAMVYQQRFGGEDGRIPATFDLVTLTAWKPHESQPKPLAPGSGKVKLIDVLKKD